MQISTKFTIAVHLLTLTAYSCGNEKITSNYLAESIGNNPVIIRNIMLQLQEASLIHVKRGTGGVSLGKELDQITFLDVYRAVETASQDDLFRFHENPNPKCNVGKNIHKALDESLQSVQQSFEKALAEHTVKEVYDKIPKQQK